MVPVDTVLCALRRWQHGSPASHYNTKSKWWSAVPRYLRIAELQYQHLWSVPSAARFMLYLSGLFLKKRGKRGLRSSGKICNWCLAKRLQNR